MKFQALFHVFLCLSPLLIQANVVAEDSLLRGGHRRLQTGPSVVFDIAPGDSSSVSDLCVLNDRLYFAASTTLFGVAELWQYDGTNNPTKVSTATGQTVPTRPSSMTAFNGKLHFYGNDADGITYLWEFNGVDAPTSVAGPFFAIPGFLRKLPVFNNKIYFSSIDQNFNDQFWEYDGTDAPTKVGAGVFTSPSFYAVFNNKLYFRAGDAQTGKGTEIFQYDGTTASIAADVNVGAGSSFPVDLIVFNNKLHFQTFDEVNGDNGLWALDATNTLERVPGVTMTGFSSCCYTSFVVFGDKLYFEANGDSGTALFEYDGSSTPSMVFDTNPGGNSSPDDFVVYNDKLYFSADDATFGSGELWEYDGTSDPARVEINPNGVSRVSHLTIFDGKLYFRGDDGTDGNELMVYETPAASAPSAIPSSLPSSNPSESPIASPTSSPSASPPASAPTAAPTSSTGGDCRLANWAGNMASKAYSLFLGDDF